VKFPGAKIRDTALWPSVVSRNSATAARTTLIQKGHVPRPIPFLPSHFPESHLLHLETPFSSLIRTAWGGYLTIMSHDAAGGGPAGKGAVRPQKPSRRAASRTPAQPSSLTPARLMHSSTTDASMHHKERDRLTLQVVRAVSCRNFSQEKSWQPCCGKVWGHHL